MSMDWFRVWHEFAADPKFIAVAGDADITIELAQGCFLQALAFASASDDRGSIAGIDLRIVAAYYRMPLDAIERCFAAFRDFGMVIGDRLAKWARRQGLEKPERALTPAARRQRSRRERLRAAEAQPQLDLAAPGAMPPDLPLGSAAVLEGVTRGVTSRDSGVTEGVTRAADSDSDSDRKKGFVRGARASDREPWDEDFAAWWEACAYQVDEDATRREYATARQGGASAAELRDGWAVYALAKPPDRHWMNPANWLRARRWRDRPAPPNLRPENLPPAQVELLFPLSGGRTYGSASRDSGRRLSAHASFSAGYRAVKAALRQQADLSDRFGADPGAGSGLAAADG